MAIRPIISAPMVNQYNQKAFTGNRKSSNNEIPRNLDHGVAYKYAAPLAATLIAIAPMQTTQASTNDYDYAPVNTIEYVETEAMMPIDWLMKTINITPNTEGRNVKGTIKLYDSNFNEKNIERIIVTAEEDGEYVEFLAKKMIFETYKTPNGIFLYGEGKRAKIDKYGNKGKEVADDYITLPISRLTAQKLMEAIKGEKNNRALGYGVIDADTFYNNK